MHIPAWREMQKDDPSTEVTAPAPQQIDASSPGPLRADVAANPSLNGTFAFSPEPEPALALPLASGPY